MLVLLLLCATAVGSAIAFRMPVKDSDDVWIDWLLIVAIYIAGIAIGIELGRE